MPERVFSGPRAFAPALSVRVRARGREREMRIRTERGVEILDVGEELVRDPVRLVELDGALEDLVRERVAPREVFGGD